MKNDIEVFILSYSPTLLLVKLYLTLVRRYFTISMRLLHYIREQSVFFKLYFTGKSLKMLVNTDQWCGSIVLFQPKLSLKFSSKFSVLRFVNYEIIAFLILLLLSHGEIEVNTEPKRKFSKFPCIHWNVNSTVVDDKLSLIKSYNTVKNYDIICIS